MTRSPNNITTYYVYLIINNNPKDERKFYIGVRSCKADSPEKDNYWGSSTSLSRAIKDIGVHNFSKKILSTWDTREMALSEEIRLHNVFDVGNNPLFYNLVKQTSIRFDTTGKITAINTLTGEIILISNDEFIKNHNLKGVQYGFVPCLNTKTNERLSVSKTEFKNNPDLKAFKNTFDFGNTGLVTARTIQGKYIKIKKEEFDIRDDLVGATKGMSSPNTIEQNQKISRSLKGKTKSKTHLENISNALKNRVSCIDITNGKRLIVPKIEFDQNHNLVGITRNKIMGPRPRDKYIVVDPYNTEYIIIGSDELIKFCKSHKIVIYHLKKHIGEFFSLDMNPNPDFITTKLKNTVGWSIKAVIKNYEL